MGPCIDTSLVVSQPVRHELCRTKYEIHMRFPRKHSYIECGKLLHLKVHWFVRSYWHELWDGEVVAQASTRGQRYTQQVWNLRDILHTVGLIPRWHTVNSCWSTLPLRVLENKKAARQKIRLLLLAPKQTPVITSLHSDKSPHYLFFKNYCWDGCPLNARIILCVFFSLLYLCLKNVIFVTFVLIAVITYRTGSHQIYFHISLDGAFCLLARPPHFGIVCC